MIKRIVHIAEAPGGVERYLVTLLTKMKKYSEFEQILICSSTLDQKKFDGLVESITVIDEMHNSISFTSDFKAIVAVRKAIKGYKPDIVYCHSSKAGAIGRIANTGFRNKLYYNAHGWSFNIKGISNKRIKIYETAEKMLAPMANKIVCISEFEKKSALEHHIGKNEKFVVINNGIDFEEFICIDPKSRAELSIPEDAFVIGTIGRLTKQKAPDVFVKMAIEVKTRIPKAFFVMVGDDIAGRKYREETERLIKINGLEKSFLITGWVADPISYIGLFDVATLLSRWEGFGLVLPEYMMMGKPIVGSQADAIPYVVGDAGLLVDIEDYKQAAEAVIRLYKDTELRHKVVEKGKERVKLFDAQRTADEHAELFR